MLQGRSAGRTNGDPPIAPYDPNGSGNDQRALIDFDVITDEPRIDKKTRHPDEERVFNALPHSGIVA
jgi:hypothetical protein